MTNSERNTTERITAQRIGFLKGKIDGITTYAVWKDGEQFVGALRTPLEKVLKPLKYELEELLGQRK